MPSGLECFGCVLKKFEEDSATELCYRASSELLGEVVVGEVPVGCRNVELIRTKGSNRSRSHAIQ